MNAAGKSLFMVYGIAGPCKSCLPVESSITYDSRIMSLFHIEIILSIAFSFMADCVASDRMTRDVIPSEKKLRLNP